MISSGQLRHLQTVVQSEISFKELGTVIFQFVDGVKVSNIQDICHCLLLQADLARVHVSEDQMEHLVVLHVLHLHALLHCLVDIELPVEDTGAGGEDTPVGGELPAVNLQDDIAEPALLPLQPQLLEDRGAVVGLRDSPRRRLEHLVGVTLVA